MGGQVPITRHFALILAVAMVATIVFPATHSQPGNPIEEMTFGNEGPAPMVNSTEEIRNIVMGIDEGLMQSHIQDLQDFKTRYSYRGDKCFEAARYIHDVFQQNNLNASYHDFVYKDFKMRNVIGEKPGAATNTGIVIVCSHYDSISGKGWTEAPGADDNGSGTAAVMAAAEVLSDYEFNQTIRFITFSGEEQYLKGSQAYVNDAIVRGDNITAVINLDMIAYNPDPGKDFIGLYLESWDPGTSQYSAASHSLANITNQTAQKYKDIINLRTYNKASGSSDHGAFNPDFPALMLLEYVFNTPNYHSPTDTIDKLNMTYCANVTQLAIATAAEVAGLNSTDNAPPSHSPGFPPDGGYGQEQPPISIEAKDPSMIAVETARMFVNGLGVNFTATPSPLGFNFSFTPPAPYSDGQIINVTFTVNDTRGNGFNHTWEFTVDAISPQPPSSLNIEGASIGLDKQGMAVPNGASYDNKWAQGPTVIYREGEYKMWYTGYDSVTHSICYATSPDGITWTKHGPVINKGTTGEPDSISMGYPTVIFDGEYKMWYAGKDSFNWRILYANSSDGIAWTKQGIALDIGAPGSLDDTYVYSPSVIKNGEYEMWYTGMDGLKYSILYANSSDGITWNKHNVDITPSGIGRLHGDGIVRNPAVVFYAGNYHMYFGRYDGLKLRTMYAVSPDGLTWKELGLAIDTGANTEPDDMRATMPCIIMDQNGTRAWYSGYDGSKWQILLATSSPHKNDIYLEWNESASSDIIRYEVYRESRPSGFSELANPQGPEFYTVPDYLTPWVTETRTVVNASVYGPTTGSEPSWFQLPDDNLIDISMYLQYLGMWWPLTEGIDYVMALDKGLVDLGPVYPLPAGCEIFAFYNYSMSLGLGLKHNIFADIGAANSSQDYYYLFRSVDKVGHRSSLTPLVGKVGTKLGQGWNLVSSPFPGTQMISTALDSAEWTAARTWEPAKEPNHWTLNMTSLPYKLNTLETVNNSQGIWVLSSPGNFSTAGQVQNMTVHLTAGWNLITYPYHEIKSVGDALLGLPWDMAEVFDPNDPYLIRPAQEYEYVLPGQGLWVHVTSDSDWVATNL